MKNIQDWPKTLKRNGKNYVLIEDWNEQFKKGAIYLDRRDYHYCENVSDRYIGMTLYEYFPNDKKRFAGYNLVTKIIKKII